MFKVTRLAWLAVLTRTVAGAEIPSIALIVLGFPSKMCGSQWAKFVKLSKTSSLILMGIKKASIGCAQSQCFQFIYQFELRNDDSKLV